MYSVEDRYTFENLQEWIENCQDSVDLDSFVWALIGNKSDLPIEVDQESVKSRCDQLLTPLCFYTSAKLGDNVVSSFEEVVKELYKKKAGQTVSAPKVKESLIKVQHTSQHKKKFC